MFFTKILTVCAVSPSHYGHTVQWHDFYDVGQTQTSCCVLYQKLKRVHDTKANMFQLSGLHL